jgi:torulene dioxygenase
VLHTGKSTLWDSIVKHDLETGEAKTWIVHGHTPGEPIFVPKPSSAGSVTVQSGLDSGGGQREGSGSSEDQGVLLSVVLDGIKGKSYLLVLDAQTMEEVGRAHVDGVVGFGFHGMHVGASS